MLGLNRSAASQQRFGQFVASELRGVFADFLERVLATDAKQTCEVKLQRDGSLAWVLVEGIAAQDRQGSAETLPRGGHRHHSTKACGRVGGSQPGLRSENHRSQAGRRETLQAEPRRNGNIPSTRSRTAVAILDDQHRIIRANRSMAERLGMTPEQCVGSRCYEVVHGMAEPPDYCPHTRTCREGREHIAEVHEPRLGGHFLISTTPRFDEQGRLIGAVHVARDHHPAQARRRGTRDRGGIPSPGE